MRWKAPESAGYIEQLFGDLQRGPGASVLSASSGEQFSYESDKYKGGIFTYELLRCMQTGEADVARDGEFHVSELLQCVARHVLDDTQVQQNGLKNLFRPSFEAGTQITRRFHRYRRGGSFRQDMLDQPGGVGIVFDQQNRQFRFLWHSLLGLSLKVVRCRCTPRS